MEAGTVRNQTENTWFIYTAELNSDFENNVKFSTKNRGHDHIVRSLLLQDQKSRSRGTNGANKYRTKFIIGAMYTPRKKSWQSTGLKPDFSVKQDSQQIMALRKIKAAERLRRDTGMLTGYKILHLK